MKLSEILMRARRILGCFQSEMMKVRRMGWLKNLHRRAANCWKILLKKMKMGRTLGRREVCCLRLRFGLADGQGGWDGMGYI